MKRVLISTLGESPGVVTEAIDYLKSRGITPDKVIILTTEDTDAQDSVYLLSDHIPKHYGMKENLISDFVKGAYEDIDSMEAVVRFLELSCSWLRAYRGDEVYVSIAGGRKTMAALMTLAVQIYGAKELFHIILQDEDLESSSRIRNLKHLDPARQAIILHPEPSKLRYVRMPFIGLFSLIGDIVTALKGRDASPEVKKLLTESDLLKNGSPTEIGKTVLRLLESVENTPGPCPERATIDLRNHHHLMERERMAQKLVSRFNFICKVTDSRWKEGQPKVKEVSPNKLEVYFRSREGFDLALLLTTTAKSEGELGRAGQLIREFLEA